MPVLKVLINKDKQKIIISVFKLYCKTVWYRLGVIRCVSTPKLEFCSIIL